MNGTLRIPTEIDFLDFFKADAVDSVPEDGYWAYEATDSRGLTLRISFNEFERSVQTRLSFMGEIVSTVSHEGAVALTLNGTRLNCEFVFDDSKANLTVTLVPHIVISWATLQTR